MPGSVTTRRSGSGSSVLEHGEQAGGIGPHGVGDGLGDGGDLPRSRGRQPRTRRRWTRSCRPASRARRPRAGPGRRAPPPWSSAREAARRRRARAGRRPDRPTTANRPSPKASAIGGHVGRGVGDPPPGLPVGLAVAGPVETDQPDAQPVQDGRARARPDPASRRSVQQEHRTSVRVPVHRSGKPPAVGCSDRSLQDFPSRPVCDEFPNSIIVTRSLSWQRDRNGHFRRFACSARPDQGELRV